MLSESQNKIDYSASFLACSPKYHCLWSSDSVGLKLKHSTCCINFSPKDFYVLCRAIAVDQEDENMPVISTHWNSICCPNDDYDYTKWKWNFFFIPLGGHVMTFVIFIPKPELSLNHPLLYSFNSDSLKIRVFQDQFVYYKYSWLCGVW